MIENSAIYKLSNPSEPTDRPVITSAQMNIIHLLKEEGRVLLSMYLEVIWNGPNADVLKEYLYTGKAEAIAEIKQPHACVMSLIGKNFSQLPPIMEKAKAVCDEATLINFLIIEKVYTLLAEQSTSSIFSVGTDGYSISCMSTGASGLKESVISLLSIIEARAEITFNKTIKL